MSLDNYPVYLLILIRTGGEFTGIFFGIVVGSHQFLYKLKFFLGCALKIDAIIEFAGLLLPAINNPPFNFHQFLIKIDKGEARHFQGLLFGSRARLRHVRPSYRSREASEGARNGRCYPTPP